MTIPELTAAQLLAALESAAVADRSAASPAAGPQILDVRAPQRAALGRIETPGYLNVPGAQFFALPDAAVLGLERSRPVVVVCDRGNSSRSITQLLIGQGFDACSLSGGMLGWMFVTVPRLVGGVSGLDRLVQLDRVGKGALGYLAERAGEALIVDPGREPSPWLALLRESGARLVGVVDTHCHADYLSGGPALAAMQGVPYYLHPADAVDPYSGRPARIEFAPLSGGGEIVVGDTRFAIDHLPGHTEGSIVLRLGDELAMTGDFLFVSSVGRPDLAERTGAWTELLWQSLEHARRAWDPALRILPAHYSCESERLASRVVEGRFGDLAERNPPLAIGQEREFAAWIGARTGRFPDEYRQIKQANLGLIEIAPELATELEAGRNQCAVSL